MDDTGTALQLIRYGVPRSALTILNDNPLSNALLNSCRAKAGKRAASNTMAAAVYAMLTVKHRYGIVVPIHCVIGNPGASFGQNGSLEDWGESAQNTFKTVYGWCVKKMNYVPGELPGIVPVTPDLVFIEGDSIGLPAALASVARLTGTQVDLPVIATGAVNDDGRILPVGDIRQKLQAVKNELNGSDGMVFVPVGCAKDAPADLEVTEVATLDEAVEIIWKTDLLNTDPELLDFAALLKKADSEPDHKKAVRLLEGINSKSLPPADRAVLFLELGKRLRHTGDIEGASEVHRKIKEILDEKAAAYLPYRATVETIEVEVLRSEMAGSTTDGMADVIVRRLAEGVSSAHNGVRLRGMLAELLSTLEKHDSVLALREDNLKIQGNSLAMKKEIPRTLCGLVWEAARAGNDAAFFKYTEQLSKIPVNGDFSQQCYNDAAIVKGMVVLKRYNELQSWLSGKKTQLFGHPSVGLIQLINGRTLLNTHPGISTVRALIRMFRKNGDLQKSVELADRIDLSAKEQMMQWLMQASQIEKALALAQMGKRSEAEQLLNTVLKLYFGELVKITNNTPAFVKVQLSDADNLDQYWWEPVLDGIYY